MYIRNDFFSTNISFAIYTKFIVANYLITLYNYIVAEIAQSVEHFTRNEGVVGSSPIFSFFYLETDGNQPSFFCFTNFLKRFYCACSVCSSFKVVNVSGVIPLKFDAGTIVPFFINSYAFSNLAVVFFDN